MNHVIILFRSLRIKILLTYYFVGVGGGHQDGLPCPDGGEGLLGEPGGVQGEVLNLKIKTLWIFKFYFCSFRLKSSPLTTD